MITVTLETSSSYDTYYVRENGSHVKAFDWKWCAIRFAKKIAKIKQINILIFNIPKSI